LSGGQSVQGKLDRREPPPTFRHQLEIDSFRVSFSAPVDHGKVSAGVRVSQLLAGSAVPVPGIFVPVSATSFLFRASRAFQAGEYTVILFGDPDAALTHGVITSKEAIPQRLDGEPRDSDPLNPVPQALPSGNSTEGGDFDFRFSVVP